MGGRGRVAVHRGFRRRILLVRALRPRYPLRMPRLPVVGLRLEVLDDVALDVGVRAWVAGLEPIRRNGIVHVIGDLAPGVEDDFLVRVVRVQRRDDSLHRIIEQHRTDPNLRAELEPMALFGTLAEEGLVLTNWFPFVVEDRPATPNPARVDFRATFDQGARLGLNLLLNLSAESIGVREPDLHLELTAWRQ